jgi:hypothetical protein
MPFLYQIGQNLAAPLFGHSTFYIQPFLSYSAEQSSSWQHCLSAGAYTTTLYVMVDIVKGGGRAPPPL